MSESAQAPDRGIADGAGPRSSPSARTVEPASPAPDWTEGFDDDLKGFVANKGWQDAHAAVEAYRRLEKFVGAERIAVPREGDAEGVKAALRRLGAPEQADGYDLAPPEGLPAGFYGDDTVDWFRELAHQASLTKTQATTLHDAWTQEMLRLDGEEAARREAEERDLDAALRQKWGQTYDQKVELARRAAARLGELHQLDALERRIGAPALVALFAGLGEAMGEDEVLGMGAAGFATTPEEARAAIAAMDADAATMAALADKRHPQHEAVRTRRSRLFDAAYPGTART